MNSQKDGREKEMNGEENRQILKRNTKIFRFLIFT